MYIRVLVNMITCVYGTQILPCHVELMPQERISYTPPA